MTTLQLCPGDAERIGQLKEVGGDPERIGQLKEAGEALYKQSQEMSVALEKVERQKHN